jgi:hypothetical protein
MLQTRATLLVEKLALLEQMPADHPGKEAMLLVMGEQAYNHALRRVKQRPGWKSMPQLEEHEKVAINCYTSEDRPWSYHEMNNALWDATTTPEKRAKYGPLNDAAVSGLAKLPGTSGTLYRGARHSRAFDERVRSQYQVDAIVQLDGFNSTSRNEDVAWRFGTAYHYVLTVYDGGKNVNPLSEYPREAEYLWEPNSRHITRMEQRHDTLWIWATQVPPTGDTAMEQQPPKRRRRVTKAVRVHHMTEAERQAHAARSERRRDRLAQQAPTPEDLEAGLVHTRKVESCEMTVHKIGMAPEWMSKRHHVDPRQRGMTVDDIRNAKKHNPS